jgi:cell wall assembly regulator SMI1
VAAHNGRVVRWFRRKRARVRWWFLEWFFRGDDATVECAPGFTRVVAFYRDEDSEQVIAVSRAMCRFVEGQHG